MTDKPKSVGSAWFNVARKLKQDLRAAQQIAADARAAQARAEQESRDLRTHLALRRLADDAFGARREVTEREVALQMGDPMPDGRSAANGLLTVSWMIDALIRRHERRMTRGAPLVRAADCMCWLSMVIKEVGDAETYRSPWAHDGSTLDEQAERDQAGAGEEVES